MFGKLSGNVNSDQPLQPPPNRMTVPAEIAEQPRWPTGLLGCRCRKHSRCSVVTYADARLREPRRARVPMPHKSAQHFR